MAAIVEPPGSLLLVVGREDHTVPDGFGGLACAATEDCVAVAVASVADAPVIAGFTTRMTRDDLRLLGRFTLETEGLLSLRDVHHREHEAAGAEPGLVVLSVWGDADREPSEVVLEVREVAPATEPLP